MKILLLWSILSSVYADCGCTSDESCCQDSGGYACCILQSTYCVAKDPALSYPARCCPQWTVGCSVGSVGCCDPARPWQRVLAEDATTTSRVAVGQASYVSVGSASPTSGGAAASTVYALFTSTIASDLTCLTIDAASGAITSSILATGPVKAYDGKLYGESTRVFPFDHTRSQFFFFDIDEVTASASSPITMYTLDPATGTSTASAVSGAAGMVVSFAYHVESASAVLAVGNRTAASFAFYHVDLDTSKATLIYNVARGASEAASPAYYSPYITTVASNGTAVFRLGYESVTTGINAGLGITQLDSTATAIWHAVPRPTGSDFFYSLCRKSGSDTFVSLAPSSSLNHTLAVYEWGAGAMAARLLIDVPDAHPPSGGGLGILGCVCVCLSLSLALSLRAFELCFDRTVHEVPQ